MQQPLEELLIFSDLHAHNFKYGSKRVGYRDCGMYNSRLLDTLGVLDEIKDYALAHGIKTILFGGDLFHRRQVYHTDVFNMVFQKIKEMSDEGLGFLMIPGNHDYADRVGLVHALQPFEALADVWVSPLVLPRMITDECTVLCVPYTPDLDTARANLKFVGRLADDTDGPTILLAHLGMQGARVGSDYILVSDGDVTVKDVPHESFTACFFGHYHQHQQLFGNGWYIGATHEQNWGDSGGLRGFLHARVFPNKVDFKHIVTDAPRFITVDGEGDITRDKDFLRMYVDTTSRSVIRRIQQQLGRKDIEVIPRLDKEETVLTLEASQLEPEPAMQAWVKANPPEGIDSTLMLEEGTAILRKALGGDL
jgi:DNA repair exonuclease SbcCD nuclease subunit